MIEAMNRTDLPADPKAIFLTVSHLLCPSNGVAKTLILPTPSSLGENGGTLMRSTLSRSTPNCKTSGRRRKRNWKRKLESDQNSVLRVESDCCDACVEESAVVGNPKQRLCDVEPNRVDFVSDHMLTPG